MLLFGVSVLIALELKGNQVQDTVCWKGVVV